MRLAHEAISEKREKRNSTILVTGITGFLGSHIAVELLKQGYPVVALCRPRGSITVLQRVERLFKWFDIDRNAASRLVPIEGFLEKPNLGLSDSRYADLLEGIDEIVHCAGSTSFSERKRDEVERSNLQALEHVLHLAVAGRCYAFHYVSSAYAAGKRTGLCKEDLVEPEQFNNVYEETKHRAERYISRVCAKEGIRANIYRPSIVYGNSKTGKSLRFNALYYPIKVLLFLKDIYLKDIREGEARKANRMGIRLDKDGSIYLPIRLEEDEEGRIDLIPIDYFVSSFITLMHSCVDGGIFHIVAERSPTLSEILQYTRDFFHIKGIKTVCREEFDRTPKNALELLYDSYLQTYHPYIRDTRRFGSQIAESVLRRHNIRCPDFTFSVFSRCMNYAVEVDWGKKLF